MRRTPALNYIGSFAVTLSTLAGLLRPTEYDYASRRGSRPLANLVRGKGTNGFFLRAIYSINHSTPQSMEKREESTSKA